MVVGQGAAGGQDHAQGARQQNAQDEAPGDHVAGSLGAELVADFQFGQAQAGSIELGSLEDGGLVIAVGHCGQNVTLQRGEVLPRDGYHIISVQVVHGASSLIARGLRLDCETAAH